MLRVVLYERVSTDEQAKKELSIPAQHEKLVAYCKQNDYKIIDTFVDDGVSAKTIKKRNGLMSLLERVDRKDIDIVLFTRLDRFTRIGKDYYILSDRLENAGTKWNAIQEDYDTTTANGQLMLEMKLAVNHNELLRTSERIKDVFASKVANGTVLGGKIPLGYKNVNKRLQIDTEKEWIPKAVFARFNLTKSKREVSKYMVTTYDYFLTCKQIAKMLQNTMYYGSYRGNDNYCPPIITKAQYDKTQADLLLAIRYSEKKNKHIYLFSRLVKCPHCGSNMVGITNGGPKNYTYYYYRCDKHASLFKCDYKHLVGENKIEKYLIENIEKIYNDYVADFNVQAEKKKPVIDKEKIKKKMTKLKELYLEDFISKEEYETDYRKYRDLLETNQEIIEDLNDLENIGNLLKGDFKTLYNSFNDVEKKSFWLGVLKSITYDKMLDTWNIQFNL